MICTEVISYINSTHYYTLQEYPNLSPSPSSNTQPLWEFQFSFLLSFSFVDHGTPPPLPTPFSQHFQYFRQEWGKDILRNYTFTCQDTVNYVKDFIKTYMSKGSFTFSKEWQTSWASANTLSLLATFPIQSMWVVLPRLISRIPVNNTIKMSAAN